MYRIIRKIAFAAALAACFTSCDQTEFGTTDSGMVTFTLQVSPGIRFLS